MQHPPCGCQSCGSQRPPDHCVHPQPPSRPPRPPKPCRPPQAQGVLLDKIIACERKFIPSLCTDLVVEGLPCCAQPPFLLTMVQQSGAQPWWTPLETQGPFQRLCMRVCIPVCCQIKASCGKHYSATSVVEVEACLTPGCNASEWWRHRIVIVPCVRLCCPPVCSEDVCFRVQLEVTLEIYLTRPEPCMMRPQTPPCPDLPLYPQPCKPPTPHCWQQCPEVPDPCGWPRQG